MVNLLLASIIDKFKGLAPELEARNSTGDGRVAQKFTLYSVTLNSLI
jgi:hypothetical protein